MALDAKINIQTKRLNTKQTVQDRRTNTRNEGHALALAVQGRDTSRWLSLTLIGVACVGGILLTALTIACLRHHLRQHGAGKLGLWPEGGSNTHFEYQAYMEDHLKNKDRLQKEWEALCSYQAEPSTCSVAQSEANLKKNRNPDFVPYDHARVKLKAEINPSRTDFINASTIIEHDPKMPAYIATQGPLSHTIADFWQMVWENGCTVIVMMTPLVEDGEKQCDRYWPDEGSSLYHIYEGLPSGASSKGAPRGVQDVPYSLDVVSSSPGYSFANQGRELPVGSAQLVERRPGGGRARSARVSSAHRAPTTPVVCPAALSSNAVALGGCMVSLQCVKKRSADGTLFGGQRVLIFAAPKSAQAW
ncbi:UNVERIFIED_CONTAM: hypothetical protein FKN15_009060 [Acipenser sinensis]